MKNIAFTFAACLAALFACTPTNKDSVKDPITVTSPTPAEQITKVALSESQLEYVKAGNAMAVRLLRQMYDGQNMIISPLSLQYALAMTANGASGETLQEMIDFLGYGDDGIDALNAYCKLLLEQLPAVDLKVNLKVTDALLVNDKFPLQPAFQKTVEDNYYAVVENMDFSDPELIAARINEWSRRNTNGVIDKVLDASDIAPELVACLMNALYFKAKWAGSDYEPMFLEESTKSEDFTLADGSKKNVKMMKGYQSVPYAKKDGYRVMALPYANYKYFMYFLLPDENNLDGLMDKIKDASWNDLVKELSTDYDVSIWLPKFTIENRYELKDALSALGLKKAFEEDKAEFFRMFDTAPGDYQYWIGKIIQKAKIAVAEWGTEAAAVTVVQMYGETATAPKEEVDFHLDHPFVFAIGESTSGAILFEGVYTGE